MHAFVLSDALLACAIALGTSAALTGWIARRARVRWRGTVGAIGGGQVSIAGYRDSTHLTADFSSSGAVPGAVVAALFVAIAQGVYLVVSHALFARSALQLDLWRVRPVAVRLVVIQSVFLVPAALVYLRAAIALVRRESNASARARFTAGAYLAIRAMRIVAGVAVASELSSGRIDWSRIAFAMPGFALATIAMAVLLRAADTNDEMPG